MSGISTSQRFFPPVSPYRAASPAMSPGRRTGRAAHSSDESHIRDLSPSTTLRAFTEDPIPFDTTDDDYKIFACISSLTPAEKDLGARVAKAAQRLKAWCEEIELWGWSGSFEPPSDELRELRRKSVEDHVREYVKNFDEMVPVAPLEYYGSLLSTEVEAHEARLDDIAEELPALEFEELKENVMNMYNHGPDPVSSRYDAGGKDVKIMDDFSILITQTLVSALPHHTEIQSHLKTWKARISILRAVPQYLEDLRTTQKAVQLAWEAIEPPSEDDLSDTALNKWKEAVNTITGVLRGKLGDLGQRIDKMLDLKEETETLPDAWIDELELMEVDFAKWMGESRRRLINLDVLRQAALKRSSPQKPAVKTNGTHSGAVKDDSAVAEPQAADVNDFGDGDDTVIHHEEAPQDPDGPSFSSLTDPLEDEGLSESASTVIATEVEKPFTTLPLGPQTPGKALRRNSIDSVASGYSLASSPPPFMDDSPSVRDATNRNEKVSRPPLNSAMTKRRGKVLKDDELESSPPWPPSKFADQMSATGADDLDRKISDILNTIPTHIRLKSGTGKDATEIKPKRPVSRISSRGYLRPARSMSGMKTPELTLARAKADADGSSNAPTGRRTAFGVRGDNDIKLYHLTQPGREQPIKLYIRRVGENGERVMVRVGGGWADLGEYLRSYAEHHGHRTASEGKFEVLGLEVKNHDSPRPGTTASMRDRRASGGTIHHTTPQKPASAGILSLNTDIVEEPPEVPSITTTPAAAVPTPSEASVPSTVSSRHSWTGNEVGLAGPKTKKLDLSEEKLEWIEGMLNQARKVSSATGGVTSTSAQALAAAHRADAPAVAGDRTTSRTDSRAESRTSVRGKPEFGDLGKVGGTKRVFLKGAD